MRIDVLLVIGAALAMGLLFMAGGDYEDEGLQTYCGMRQIHEDSRGEWGWPAFDDDKEEMCE